MISVNSGKSAIIENFQPMPKRFMVWDKNNLRFMMVGEAYPLCQLSEGMKGSTVFSLQDLVALFSEILYYDNSDDYIICQSTNFYAKSRQEVFEGSILHTDKEGNGYVYMEDNGQWRVLFRDKTHLLFDILYAPSCELVGHILTDPELLEDENV